MTRKAAARGRKSAAKRSPKPAPRARTRTGKKTSSARAANPKAAARTTVQRKRPAPRRAPSRPADPGQRPEELRREQVQTVVVQEEEDLDWLAEDEDPRSQIVEDEEDDWIMDREDE